MIEVYEGDEERSTTAKGVMYVNTLRALSYFLVSGVQVAYCTTEAPSCGLMIVLVPLSLGVMDSLLIWQSGRDTSAVRFAAILLSIFSLSVAIDTLAPIYYADFLTSHMFFMLNLSLVIIILSIIEFVVIVYDLANPKSSLEGLKISSSTRTY
jgi:hypothetical protein